MTAPPRLQNVVEIDTRVGHSLLVQNEQNSSNTHDNQPTRLQNADLKNRKIDNPSQPDRDLRCPSNICS